MRYHVLDLSTYNRKWNFDTAKMRGIHGAILKASQVYVDLMFPTNWPALQDSGLLAGAYHYFVPSKSATEQAEKFYNLIKGGRLELGAWLDLEYNAGKDPATENPYKIKDYGVRVQEFLIRMEQLGIRPGIYTNPSHSYTHLAKWEIFCTYELWLANPQNGQTRTVPNCPVPFWADSWRGWQYTWKLPNPTWYGAPADSIKGLDGSIFRW